MLVRPSGHSYTQNFNTDVPNAYDNNVNTAATSSTISGSSHGYRCAWLLLPATTIPGTINSVTLYLVWEGKSTTLSFGVGANLGFDVVSSSGNYNFDATWVFAAELAYSGSSNQSKQTYSRTTTDSIPTFIQKLQQGSAGITIYGDETGLATGVLLKYYETWIEIDYTPTSTTNNKLRMGGNMPSKLYAGGNEVKTAYVGGNQIYHSDLTVQYTVKTASLKQLSVERYYANGMAASIESSLETTNGEEDSEDS